MHPAMNDIGAYIKTDHSIYPQVATATVTGNVVDRDGFMSAEMFAAVGSVSASTTVAVKVQHGTKSDGSDMADYTDPTPNAIPTLNYTSVDVNVTRRKNVNLQAANRYVREVATIAGGTPSVPISAGLALGGAYQKPQNT